MSSLSNDDVFGCMISFLDINTMENLAESTEENQKIVGKFQHVYYKNYLVEKERGYFDIKRSFNGKYRRLEFDSPSFTIDTNFGTFGIQSSTGNTFHHELNKLQYDC